MKPLLTKKKLLVSVAAGVKLKDLQVFLTQLCLFLYTYCWMNFIDHHKSSVLLQSFVILFVSLDQIIIITVSRCLQRIVMSSILIEIWRDMVNTKNCNMINYFHHFDRNMKRLVHRNFQVQIIVFVETQEISVSREVKFVCCRQYPYWVKSYPCMKFIRLLDIILISYLC